MAFTNLRRQIFEDIVEVDVWAGDRREEAEVSYWEMALARRRKYMREYMQETRKRVWLQEGVLVVQPRCLYCGKPIPVARMSKRGQPRKYCTDACKQEAYRARNAANDAASGAA